MNQAFISHRDTARASVEQRYKFSSILEKVAITMHWNSSPPDVAPSLCALITRPHKFSNSAPSAILDLIFTFHKPAVFEDS